MEETPINGDIKLQKGAVDTIRGVFQSFSYVGPAADVAILLLGTVEF